MNPSLMDERDQIALWRNEDIRAKIETGLASLRAGNSVDGEAVFDRLMAELDADDRNER